MNADQSGPLLEFAWDPHKAQSNLAKHGVSFAQATTVLLDALALTVFDEAHSDFEEQQQSDDDGNTVQFARR